MSSRRHTNNAEDISLESTVPTDLSFSPDEISDLHTTDDDRMRVGRFVGRAIHGGSAQRHHGHSASDRKQLEREVQKLRVDLSKKNLKLENLETEHHRKVADLEQKLAEALHQQQFLQTRLDAQLGIDGEEMRRRQEAIAHELDTILRRQQQLEATNERLQEKAIDIRHSLKDLDLTDANYQELRLMNEDDVSLKDFVSMKLYENQRPWKFENENLKSRCRKLSEELSQQKMLLESCQDELHAEKEQISQLELKLHRLNLAYSDTKSQIQHGDYKLENYDRVKMERDEFERLYADMQKQHAFMESSHQAVLRERDDLHVEVSAVKQAVTLLTKDKEFYAKQLCQVETKLRYADDRIVQLNEQLEKTKQAREDLFNEYVISRDKYHSDYEEKLRSELEQIRVRTDAEIDRLKTSTREMYERENRGLREARDLALSEKDRAVDTERDTNTKYEQLLQDFRQLQMNNDSKVSELHNEVKLKVFEAERTQLVYEETCRVLKQAQFDNEKLNSKLEVLTREYYGLQTAMEKRVAELEAGITEKSIKLDSYEKLEYELDEVVMQAADVETDDDAERVLFSYGYGANVPSTAKRRLKHSVQLARRVLQLERNNAALHKELQQEKDRVKQLADDLNSVNTLLDESKQPYQYLIESIRRRDVEIVKLRQTVDTLDADLRTADSERRQLSKLKNQMSVDLERLLSHKEEMAVMKQVVLNLGQPQYVSTSSHQSAGGKKLSTGVKKDSVRPSVTFEQAERDDNVYKPQPTEFTASGPADWYSRLRQKQQQQQQTADRGKLPAARHSASLS